MKTSTQKYIAQNIVSSVVGLTINHAIDQKLAKSENPGKINRFMRWNFRLGRNPYYLAAVAAVVVGVAIANEKSPYTK